ncbi:MAG: lysophospholipid acyltransferase family protein [Planctomycetes bacterium]|nr:lysophospholipid acyltransferase family protein [Planctomycetota bacterium]
MSRWRHTSPDHHAVDRLRAVQRVKWFLVSRLGPLLVRVLGSTLRFEIRGMDRVRELHGRGKRVIYAFWHGRMILPAYTHRREGVAILISRHGDGEIIARIVERLGFLPIRGSTTRGGGPGLLEMLRAAERGHDLAFTPDGPRGPKFVVQPGVVYAAQKTGLPIIPSGIAAGRPWVLKSWDGFQIPKPFSRACIVCAEPIDVPRDLSESELETMRQRVEDAVRRATDEADARARGEWPVAVAT